jgi:peptidylprolyl isomerase
MRPLLTILLLLTAFVRAGQTLGKIGDIELTTTEIRESLAGLEATQEAALAKDPAAIGQYVRALLIQRLLLKQATDSRFDQDPAVIARLVRARETALTEAYLASLTQPPAGYPSDSELQAAYDAAKDTLLIPKTYRLAQIFTKDPAKAQDLHKKLKAKPADFAALAKAHSEEPTSAANGGEIGWLAENQIQPEIKAQLPKLAKDTLSAPIQLADGHHLIKLLDTREAATATLEQVRPQLTAKLRQEKSQQLRQEHLAALLKANPLAINEIELSKILSSGR